MKIGTKEFPDNCPNGCGILLKRPGMRLMREGSCKSYSTFCGWCSHCNFETETVKLLDKPLKIEEFEDVTIYKNNWFKKLFK